MEKKTIDHIIRTFFGKRFPKHIRHIFGQWLCAPGGQQEKIEAMAEVWRTIPETADEQTYKDWLSLADRIGNRKTWQTGRTRLYKWKQYAAAVVVLTFSIGMTYLVTNRLTPYKTIDMVEVFIPYGDTRYIRLPDETKVWVSAGSVLIYPEEFAADNRPVFLSGEATFEVEPDCDKPFYVKTHYIDVEVTGTKFTVKSYPDDLFTTTTLEEGKVAVAIKNKTSGRYPLIPGQQLVYSNREGSFYVHDIDMDIYRMERKGFLVFDNTPVEEILVALERKYNVTFHYNTSFYRNHTYNVKFMPGETVGEAMEVLRLLTGMNYTIQGSNIYINDKRR